MKQFRRLWGFVFFLTLLVPGYALGTATFTFYHPGTVVVGQTFDVIVSLSDDDPSHNINAYSYCFDYDQGALELVPQDIACTYTSPCDPGDIICIADPPVDGNFFGGTCPDCRAIYHPVANNFVPGPVPPPLANIQFQDAGDVTAQGTCPCARAGVYNLKLVSTYTFRALRAGTTEFIPNMDCTEIVSCDGSTQPPIIVVPPIIIVTSAVPTFSGSGIGFFALGVALCFILIARRFRKHASRSSALSLLLVLGITLGVGALWADVAQAVPVCPGECIHLNLDINRDASVNVSDSYMLYRCLKMSSCDATMDVNGVKIDADVNGDGLINWDDYGALVQCIQKGCVKLY
jgi:hypothetical protein